MLAADLDPFVREAVAGNPNTPAPTGLDAALAAPFPPETPAEREGMALGL